MGNAMRWISTGDELPPEDGIYRITNHPDFESDPFNRGMVSLATYDGYGFEMFGIYRKPKFWQKCEFQEKKYGKVMTKDELIEKLNDIKVDFGHDEEVAHIKADGALLEYINDERVSDSFERIPRWYA